MDPEIDSEGLDAFDIVRILQQAVGGVFLLLDIDALVTDERRDVETALLVDVISRLDVTPLSVLGAAKASAGVGAAASIAAVTLSASPSVPAA